MGFLEAPHEVRINDLAAPPEKIHPLIFIETRSRVGRERNGGGFAVTVAVTGIGLRWFKLN